ncbi:stanniocalcin-2-like [Amphiprion ocellaris]|uniref:stanniocalcin-2-like n=1 Tax=Amphiprion ocellaris TaxID=80972 RepID=UPI002410E865|nr:stanniocalcin-2-like [Amphiprion ocellaris]
MWAKSAFVVPFLLLACHQVLSVDPHDVQEKQVSQVKRRLSPQSAAEIQSCLVSSGDVGCGMFQCFNNNSCDIQGLHHICLTLLHNAGRYDSQVSISNTAQKEAGLPSGSFAPSDFLKSSSAAA